MKNYLIYAAMACAMLLSASCAKNEPEVPVMEGPGFVLTLSTGEEAAVSVKADTEDPYNESLLNSFWYFLYPEGVLDEAPTVSGFVNGISKVATKDNKYTKEIPVSANTINNILFADSRLCRLFVVANPTDDMLATLNSEPDLETLRAVTVVSALKNGKQDNFIMVYDNTVQVTSRTGETAIECDVPLKRLACKFTIGAYVTPMIVEEEKGKKYEPVLDEGGLEVTFCNGLQKTTLSGFNKDIVEDKDYFDAEPVSLGCTSTTPVEVGEEGSKESLYEFKSTTPVYTYPMEWEFASKSEPYLMYKLTWKVTNIDGTGNADYQPLYYKLTLGRRALNGNDFYDISAKLTVLGSLLPEDPTDIYPYMNYQILGWVNAFGINPNTPAVIQDTRYLAVPQTDWVLNNKDEVTIPFSSSHECEVVNAKMVTCSYSTGVKVSTTANLNPSNTTPVAFDLSKMNQVTVTHTINNTLGKNMDVTPVEIEFDIRHKTNASFTEHIKITQYPAIFLETFANSGGRSATNDYGYTYVNSRQSGNWQVVQGANSSGNNSSIYLTVITVTQFDPSTGFIVGDPRTAGVDNLDINSSTAGVQWNAVNPVSAPAKYKGDGQSSNRPIKYYRPTIDDGSVDNMVAPSFRVNSANCRSGQNETYENARQRCAAYQEDGYPAGRWRLPTLAECKVIQTMSSNDFVPKIFIQTGNTAYYCYSGGWFTGTASQDSDYHPYTGTPSYSKTTSTGGQGGGAARCVYDEWYWSQIDKEFGWDNSTKTFTWGDMPKDYVHNTASN